MTDVVTKPDTRPDKPCFSSGPCAKRPGWTEAAIADAWVPLQAELAHNLLGHGDDGADDTPMRRREPRCC